MYTLPDLQYDYSSLDKAIDEETMRLHHGKHHAKYIENTNDALSNHQDLFELPVEELIQSLDKVPEDIRTKVRNNAGGHANHTLFWTIMTPNEGSSMSSSLEDKIGSTFGDIDSFKSQFNEAAAGVFGSGWAWLAIDNGDLKIVTTPNQDSPLMNNQTPILGLDVWEHAYYLRYQNRRPEYIDAWWKIVNWEEVSRRFEESI